MSPLVSAAMIVISGVIGVLVIHGMVQLSRRDAEEHDGTLVNQAQRLRMIRRTANPDEPLNEDLGDLLLGMDPHEFETISPILQMVLNQTGMSHVAWDYSNHALCGTEIGEEWVLFEEVAYVPKISCKLCKKTWRMYCNENKILN